MKNLLALLLKVLEMLTYCIVGGSTCGAGRDAAGRIISVHPDPA